MMGGKMMLWFSDRDGLASKANSGSSQTDAYGLFFTQDAWDTYRLNKDEAALIKDVKDKAEKADTTKKAVVKKDSVMIDWAFLENRKARLTIHSSSLNDALVDKEGHIRGVYDGTDTMEVNRLLIEINLLLGSYKK